MIRKVLIADDDQTLLKLLSKKFEKFSGVFEPVLALDGINAVNILEKEPVSLVISDLQMPRLDGFALLNHIKEFYPDIPVIIITAFGKPKSRQVILGQGAVEYLEKPIVIDELANTILKYLNKETEGGLLNNASLEMFIQLIEMELKTCTIRVNDKKSNKRGVLFFKEGELIDARIGKLHGNTAAYRIFAWTEVAISIENVCLQKRKIVEGDLQAILLEAMRLKDEASDDGLPLDEDDEIITARPASHQIQMSQPQSVAETISKQETAPVVITDPVKIIENKIKQNPKTALSIASIKTEPSREELVNAASGLGAILKCGSLKFICITEPDKNESIIIADKPPITIETGQKSSRDEIIRML
jgi:CheY-like chemotaxis protein